MKEIINELEKSGYVIITPPDVQKIKISIILLMLVSGGISFGIFEYFQIDNFNKSVDTQISDKIKKASQTQAQLVTPDGFYFYVIQADKDNSPKALPPIKTEINKSDYKHR